MSRDWGVNNIFEELLQLIEETGSPVHQERVRILPGSVDKDQMGTFHSVGNLAVFMQQLKVRRRFWPSALSATASSFPGKASGLEDKYPPFFSRTLPVTLSLSAGLLVHLL